MQPDATTLGEQLRTIAAANPDKLALVGEHRALTWAALDAEVDRVARGLASLGVKKGDPVGLCVSKRPELVITFLALARIGGIAAPVNYKLEDRHLVDQFFRGNLTVALVEPRYEGVLSPVAHQLREVIHLDTPEWSELDGDPVEREVQPEDPVYYNYTSGTTGQPKGAVASHANILWNALSGVEGLDFRADDVFLCMFSAFAHPHELFHRALLTGSTCVVIDTLSPRVVAQAIEKHGITWMMAVPSFYEMVLSHVGPDRYDVGSLRVLESGGAWVPPDTLTRLEARFGCHFMPVWGSTETNGVVLALRPGNDRRAGATGTVVDHYEVDVVDKRGRPVANGETGEMRVRGPAVASHYVDMPDESAVAFSDDGWYRTSDLVRRDEDGFFWFVGRKSDLLKVGGIRVFPLEIEQVLHAHPEVVEAVVVRAVERVRGEVPRAVIRLAEGSNLDVNAVKAWCRGQLAPYKVPRIVEVVDAIPHLPNGKVDRKAIEAS